MNDRDKLMELLKKADNIASKKLIMDYDDAIADNADYLLANGVIVTKYKVGDRVWYITGIHGTIVKPAIVDEIIINCNGVSDLFVTSDTASFENSVDIFYPTKEEAEQALAERSADNA